MRLARGVGSSNGIRSLCGLCDSAVPTGPGRAVPLVSDSEGPCYGAEMSKWVLDASVALARFDWAAEELALMARDQEDSDPPPAVADLNRRLVVVYADMADALAGLITAIRQANQRTYVRAVDRATELSAEGERLAFEVDDLARECRDTG